MQALHDHISKDGFRLRGTAVSRIDGFSDVVFGFALTMLVVSLEVPKNFAELHASMQGFIPFGLTFLMLMLIWYSHYKFFRRYGLHDLGTIWLNGILLFMVLFFVYPLKFMFTQMFNGGAGIDGAHVGTQVREMTLLYAGGYIAIYALFALMYWNALRRREKLGLSPLETDLTRLYLWQEVGNTAVGVAVAILAMLLPAGICSIANFGYTLIFIHKTVLGQRIGNLCRKHKTDDGRPSVDL